MSRATLSDRADRLDSPRLGSDEIEALHEEIERLPRAVPDGDRPLRPPGADAPGGRPAAGTAGRDDERPAVSGAGAAPGPADPTRLRAPGRSAGRRRECRPSGGASRRPWSIRRHGSRWPSPRRRRPASVPPAIAALSREVSRSMLIIRLTMISATALAVGTAATGAWPCARTAAQGSGRRTPSRSSPDRPLLARRRRLPPPMIACRLVPDCGWEPRGSGRLRSCLRWRCRPTRRRSSPSGDELIVWDAATGKERWRAHGEDYGFDPPAASYGVRARGVRSRRFPLLHAGIGRARSWSGRPSSGRRDVLTVLPLSRCCG